MLGTKRKGLAEDSLWRKRREGKGLAANKKYETSELGFVEAFKHLRLARANEAAVFPANEDAEAGEDHSEDKQDDCDRHRPQHNRHKLRYKPAEGDISEDVGQTSKDSVDTR